MNPDWYCSICKATPLEKVFSKTKLGYLHSYCRQCDNARGKHSRQVLKPEAAIISRLKSRCKQRNLEFNLDVSDIIIPEYCPILGIKLSFNSSIKDNSVSVDRIDSKRGYVKGNIMIISMRANRIKTDASIEELEAVINFMKKES